MSLFEELVALPAGDEVAARRPSHPKGWEPGVRYDGETRTITTPPAAAIPEGADGLYRDLLETMGQAVPDGYRVRLAEAKYDPAAWTRQSEGEDALTAPVWRYRFVVEPAPAAGAAESDVTELVQSILRHKPPRVPASERGKADPAGFCVVIGDWQVGKSDGDGTGGLVGRVLAAIDDVAARIKELRRSGRHLETLYVLGVGDILESCDGHYPMQANRVQLGLTEQQRLARVLLFKAITAWSKLFERVIVAAVQGNHGEVRREGKAFTHWGDNFDTDVFAQVMLALEANPEAYGHISFVFPQEQEITLTLDVYGTVVGLAHGHQTRSPDKIPDWLAKQGLGRQPIGDADVLVTGHFHHTLHRDLGAGRMHFQCPALDGGSDWYRHQAGTDSPPGLLTFVVGKTGWRDLAIL